jgi:hypothetical protein
MGEKLQQILDFLKSPAFVYVKLEAEDEKLLELLINMKKEKKQKIIDIMLEDQR